MTPRPFHFRDFGPNAGREKRSNQYFTFYNNKLGQNGTKRRVSVFLIAVGYLSRNVGVGDLE